MVHNFSQKQVPASIAATAALVVAAEASLSVTRDFTPPDEFRPSSSLFTRQLNFMHQYSLAVFTLLFLAVGVAGIKVGSSYWSAHIISQVKPAVALTAKVHTIAGLNLTVPAKDLQAKLQTITSQSASMTVGTQTVPVSPDTIRGWLQITPNSTKSDYTIRIKAGTIAASLTQQANQFVKAPINQVTVSEDGVNQIVVGGRNGTALTDPSTLQSQADQVAKTVMNAKGLQFNTPLQTQAFQSVTPAAFDKLLVANITTKKMWAFQNGQEVNSWLVSAGKPTTPTPVGEFHIYAKYAVQDMRGLNPDNTPYFQPHVRWVNYFSAGSAIHGVYWHPLSWFGAINSSHGCVGVPDDEAAWIYNWAPIGTTVITQA